MKVTVLALCLLVAVAGCGGQNKNEALAQRITEAVTANDMRPVQDDIAPGVQMKRVQVAEWSDELNEQGKLLSLKQSPTCPPIASAGSICFVATFEKRPYNEWMRLDNNGKVAAWNFKAVDASSPPP